jgi:Family of unknown function (DUF5675)
MILTIKRQSKDATTILGTMFLDDVQTCFTLENAALCIPAGTYPADLYPSPHFGFIVPRLTNVPGRVDIEVHPGNSCKDFHGCIGVGSTQSHDWIGESNAAFKALMLKLDEPLTVVVEDVPDPSRSPAGEATGSN